MSEITLADIAAARRDYLAMSARIDELTAKASKMTAAEYKEAWQTVEDCKALGYLITDMVLNCDELDKLLVNED